MDLALDLLLLALIAVSIVQIVQNHRSAAARREVADELRQHRAVVAQLVQQHNEVARHIGLEEVETSA
jgi:hypothetical protein